MSDQRGGSAQLGLSRGPTDPSGYSSADAKTRFAVAKYYGMGSNGQWSVEEIADALDVSSRQVYKYLRESEIGREVLDVLSTTEAEWRLDAALHLRGEIEQLEDIEEKLLQRTTAAPTEFDEETVEGIPTADGVIVITDAEGKGMNLPVPSEHEEIVDYGPDLERVQKEKRKHIQQIVKLLGLDVHEGVPRPRGPSEGSEGRTLVEYRDCGDGGNGDNAR